MLGKFLRLLELLAVCLGRSFYQRNKIGGVFDVFEVKNQLQIRSTTSSPGSNDCAYTSGEYRPSNRTADGNCWRIVLQNIYAHNFTEQDSSFWFIGVAA